MINYLFRSGALVCQLSCLLLVSAYSGRAATLVAGTNPRPDVNFFVENDSSGYFNYEQLFTLSSDVQVTSLSLNLGSFTRQTLRVDLFSGLGLEGTGTLLQSFNINAPQMSPGTFDLPSVTTPTSLSLAAGSYSLLLTNVLPNPSTGVIYQYVADSSNTPYGSLGGTTLVHRCREPGKHCI